jgi:TolB protein
MMRKLLWLFIAVAFLPASQLAAQQKPLRIEITDGVIEPLPIAVPTFIAENAGAADRARDIARVVANDLVNSGLFREVPESAHISRITSFGSPVQFSDWKAVNAQALISGAISVSGGKVNVKFRLFDVFAQTAIGEGLQFSASSKSWRRLAHKVADAVYQRLTGEGGYFDSRVAFISETGPKNARLKRLAVMDYDGQNVQFLTGDKHLVLAPRFSPDGKRLIYTSYETGMPRVFLMEIARVRRKPLDNQPGMTFAPRFSPDGARVVMSLTNGANTDIYSVALGSGKRTRITSSAAIDTGPSFSPDGRFIVFESDRSGGQQLYIVPSSGGTPKRISFGDGRYGTPVWSPRGDLIAFTKKSGRRFHIGVMRTDGSEERLLTSSFLDEGPTWSPNGRVIMFFRETSGANGSPALYSVDISGRNLRKIPTPNFGSDPSWGPLIK